MSSSVVLAAIVRGLAGDGMAEAPVCEPPRLVVAGSATDTAPGDSASARTASAGVACTGT
jgi:hypothetical protein